MAYYNPKTGKYDLKLPSPEMDNSNPNKQFKHRKWLENLISDDSSSNKVAEQATTKEYVDKHVGVGVDITSVGDSTITKVDQNGNEYEEKTCVSTGVQYLTFKSEKQKITEVKETERFKKWREGFEKWKEGVDN